MSCHSIILFICSILSTFVFCPFLLTIIVSVCSQITLFVIFKLVLNGWCGVSLNLSTVRENQTFDTGIRHSRNETRNSRIGQFIVLSYLQCYKIQLCTKSNTTGVSSGVGTANPSGAHSSPRCLVSSCCAILSFLCNVFITRYN